jgi:hypothetical protein
MTPFRTSMRFVETGKLRAAHCSRALNTDGYRCCARVLRVINCECCDRALNTESCRCYRRVRRVLPPQLHAVDPSGSAWRARRHIYPCREVTNRRSRIAMHLICGRPMSNCRVCSIFDQTLHRRVADSVGRLASARSDDHGRRRARSHGTLIKGWLRDDEAKSRQLQGPRDRADDWPRQCSATVRPGGCDWPAAAHLSL